MPPPSPVPGWARGEVCRERTASRRMPAVAYRRLPKSLRAPGKTLGPPPALGIRGSGGRGEPVGGGGTRGRRFFGRRLGFRVRGGAGLVGRAGRGFAALVLVVTPEREVDANERLLLLLADRLVGHDGAGQVGGAGGCLEDARLHVERLGRDAQRLGDLLRISAEGRRCPRSIWLR